VRVAFLFTCEHGGNRIPARYRTLFAGRRALLDSHRGFDPGALLTAKALAKAFAAPLVASTVSRLLVDLNRSLGHRQVFSPMTRAAPAALRVRIVEEHYRPHRTEVERLVRGAIARGRRVIHVASHSFTPVLDGDVRTADVGLLYDPRRRRESALCARWKDALAARAPALRVRRNYPYAGKADGLTSYLRTRFSPANYVGVELEVNQRIVAAGAPGFQSLRRMLVETLRSAATA
jgi:predicted N-formylglutamate amidohydrolase